MWRRLIAAVAAVAAVAIPAFVHAQHVHGTGPSAGGSVRVTMEALHAAGGVPQGWKFTLPAGDPRAGRQSFVDFKCYACHVVKGERFPGESSTAGPELTGM